MGKACSSGHRWGLKLGSDSNASIPGHSAMLPGLGFKLLMDTLLVFPSLIFKPVGHPRRWESLRAPWHGDCLGASSDP